jgi:hypothetical protein
LVVLDDSSTQAEIYSVADGSLIRRFTVKKDLGQQCRREAIAVSPGGNQLAALLARLELPGWEMGKSGIFSGVVSS